jgi:hypothetical protein
MNIVDENGYYMYNSGTKTLAKSSHPAWQARLMLGLPIGTWVCRPDQGHDLAQYNNVKEAEETIERFEKDLQFYLKKFGPDVIQTLGNRGAVDFQVQISSEALNEIPVL